METIDYIVFGLLILYIIILFTSNYSDAYTINYAKSISNFTKNIKPIPQTITINKITIDKINNCHSYTGSVAYQSGYADACDYLKEILGLRTNKFSSRPQLIQDTTLYYKIPITKNYVQFNASFNKFEFFDNNMTKQNPYRIFRNNLTWINITYIRIYM